MTTGVMIVVALALLPISIGIAGPLSGVGITALLYAALFWAFTISINGMPLSAAVVAGVALSMWGAGLVCIHRERRGDHDR